MGVGLPDGKEGIRMFSCAGLQDDRCWPNVRTRSSNPHRNQGNSMARFATTQEAITQGPLSSKGTRNEVSVVVFGSGARSRAAGNDIVLMGGASGRKSTICSARCL